MAPMIPARKIVVPIIGIIHAPLDVGCAGMTLAFDDVRSKVLTEVRPADVR